MTPTARLRRLVLVLPLMLIASGCVIFPRPVTVTPDYEGVVRAADGEPVANAVVTLNGFGESVSTKTTASGAFAIARQKNVVWLHWFVPPGWWYLYEPCSGYLQIEHEAYALSRFYFETNVERESVLCRGTELLSDVTLLPTGSPVEPQSRESVEEALTRDLYVGMRKDDVERYFQQRGISYARDANDALHGFVRIVGSTSIAIRVTLENDRLAELSLTSEIWP